jgi:hypothetical protein
MFESNIHSADVMSCPIFETGRRNDLQEMEVVATAEQRQKMKKDKEAEKKQKRKDKKTAGQNTGDVRKPSIRNLNIDGNNPMSRISAVDRVIVGDTSTNPISAVDNRFRTRTGSSSQQFDI